MNNWLTIAAGGAIGALLRAAITGLCARVLGTAFPYGTLLVNVSGSLLIGVLFVYLQTITASHLWLRSFMMIGLLGALTTFSSFSLESLVLWQQGESLRALAYVLCSVLLSLFAVCIGAWVTKTIMG